MRMVAIFSACWKDRRVDLDFKGPRSNLERVENGYFGSGSAPMSPAGPRLPVRPVCFRGEVSEDNRTWREHEENDANDPLRKSPTTKTIFR